MSTRGGGGGGGGGGAGYSRAPAHQNTFAFKHNPNSRKTRAIASIPNTGLCARCHDLIEWKKRYRKYKPLDKPRKCTACHQHAVKSAYHVVCGPCAAAKRVCAKCLLDKALFEPADAATRELREQIEFIETHRGAIPGLPERQRRAVLRELQRELAGHAGGEQPPPPPEEGEEGGEAAAEQDEGEEEGGAGAGARSAAAGRGAVGGGDGGDDDEEEDDDDDDDLDEEEEDDDDDDEGEDDDDADDDDKFVSDEAVALKKALAAARAKRRATEAADRQRAAAAAVAAARQAAGPHPPGGSSGGVCVGALEDGPLAVGADARPDPWSLQQRLAKMVVTPRLVLAHGAAHAAATAAAAAAAAVVAVAPAAGGATQAMAAGGAPVVQANVTGGK